MAMTQAQLVLAFQEEAGDVTSLASTIEITRWFNAGQARLLRKFEKTADITWAAAVRSVALPADFVQMRKLVLAAETVGEEWQQFGDELVIDHHDGASAAGGARLYYYAEWPDVTDSVSSSLTKVEDVACLHYALSRFYKKLSSNRAYYKRYATLVGANAVSERDIQDEADRWYNDFLDAREDVKPPPPESYYRS
jgi:hypothetical protein